MSDMDKYLDMFIEESTEHLQNINTQLLELEKQPDNISVVEEIFRSAHTLKGMAASMEFSDLANLTHVMENVLDGIRNNQIQVTAQLLDVIFNSVDHLETMVESISSGGDGKADVTDVVADLQKIEAGEESESSPAATNSFQLEYDQFDNTVIAEAKEQNQNAFEVTVTIDEGSVLKGPRAYMVFQALEETGEIIKVAPQTEDIENGDFDLSFALLLITEQDKDEIQEKVMGVSEVEKVEITAAEPIEEKQEETTEAKQEEEKPKKTEQENNKPAQNKSIRVNIDRLDNLMNLFEELIIDRGRLEQIAASIDDSNLNETVERMTRVSGDLQNIILNMRMVQVESVFNRFPRMVRKLSRELEKDINFEIEGAETELDRTVIDDIGDPLVHLIRNALDHGIESPEKRVANGKSEAGTIVLKAYHKGNTVFIEVQDDGGGLNTEKILNKAIENGVITKEEANTLTPDAVNQLIFSSGFSTADTVSDISGRGVGLDVVRSNIEKLSGSIRITSEEGKGSTFSIELPLTLSIIASMLVKVREEQYAIPLLSILETATVKAEDVQYVHKQKVMLYREKIIPLIFLDEYLEAEGHSEEKEKLYVIVVQKGDEIAGLVVDELIRQQEIVLKSLGDYLKDTHSISGATILGDGTTALILDTGTLIGRAVSHNE